MPRPFEGDIRFFFQNCLGFLDRIKKKKKKPDVTLKRSGHSESKPASLSKRSGNDLKSRVTLKKKYLVIFILPERLWEMIIWSQIEKTPASLKKKPASLLKRSGHDLKDRDSRKKNPDVTLKKVEIVEN